MGSCRDADTGMPRHLQVCKFYLAGQCAYGSKCRYDHVRPEYTKRQQQTPQQVQEQQRAGAAGPSSPSSSRCAASGWCCAHP
jgi:hypothetical protein